MLQAVDPADEMALVWLDDEPVAGGGAAPTAGEQVNALLTLRNGAWLSGGGDGEDLTAAVLKGGPADPDNINRPARGLGALGEIEDIAIVAVARHGRASADAEQQTAVQDLIAHCEQDALPDRRRRPARGAARSPRSASSGRSSTRSTPRSTTRGCEIVDPTRRPDPGDAAAAARHPAVGLRRRDLRPQRHRARRPQGTGERGGPRHHRTSPPTSPTTGSRCSTPRASTRCASSRAAQRGCGAPAP